MPNITTTVYLRRLNIIQTEMSAVSVRLEQRRSGIASDDRRMQELTEELVAKRAEMRAEIDAIHERLSVKADPSLSRRKIELQQALDFAERGHNQRGSTRSASSPTPPPADVAAIKTTIEAMKAAFLKAGEK